MKAFRIYTKTTAKAAARLADTVYREDDAIRRAGEIALRTGRWVHVVIGTTDEPNRWD